MTPRTRPAIRDDHHGTQTNYQYGCRCDLCTRANTVACNARSGYASLATDCTNGRGKTSECIQLAGRLVQADADIQRIARLANRSRESFAKWSDDLRAAKAAREQVRARRDEHMAECPAAAVRFGAA